MNKLSIVIPALNESENIPKVMSSIRLARLDAEGWDTEVIVVDNASTDGTGEVAASVGARVVYEPARGYGNAYKAGFAAAHGDVIATGDADCTYPFDALPELLRILIDDRIDFLSTNRLGIENRPAMKPSHVFGNRALTAVSRLLFRSPFRDSQSGMWVFKREVWQQLNVRSDGMAFSQEIKNEAYLRGLHCAEVPIDYRVRGGQVKLNAGRDGIINLTQLISHRVRGRGARPGTALSDVTPLVPKLAVERSAPSSILDELELGCGGLTAQSART